jgi:hypothetical protein
MFKKKPIPSVAHSKEWVCGRSLGGIVDSNPAWSTDVCYGCCVLSGKGLCVGMITRPEDGCGVSECGREASVMRRPWPTRGSSAMEEVLIGSWAGYTFTITQISILFMSIRSVIILTWITGCVSHHDANLSICTHNYTSGYLYKTEIQIMPSSCFSFNCHTLFSLSYLPSSYPLFSLYSFIPNSLFLLTSSFISLFKI